MSVFWFITIYLIIVLAVWQSVEICHHSVAGTAWREAGTRLSGYKYMKYLGEGMLCPFCYSNWFGIFYVGCYTAYVFNFVEAVAFTFVGGLAAARLANTLNDVLHNQIRTPNAPGNTISRSGYLHALHNEIDDVKAELTEIREAVKEEPIVEYYTAGAPETNNETNSE